MIACSVLGVRQIFTSFNNPKRNADAKYIFKNIEKRSNMVVCETYAEVEEALTKWIRSYNEDFLHSARGHKTPEESGKESYI